MASASVATTPRGWPPVAEAEAWDADDVEVAAGGGAGCCDPVTWACSGLCVRCAAEAAFSLFGGAEVRARPSAEAALADLADVVLVDGAAFLEEEEEAVAVARAVGNLEERWVRPDAVLARWGG